MENRNLLTVTILTFNEEKNIRKCIESLNHIYDRLIILDNYSTDKTIEYAKNYGAEVIQINKHPRERIKFVLKKGFIKTKWVLFIDADERMTTKSADEFINLCEKYKESKRINGIVVKYMTSFMGKNLKHGGFSSLKKLRAFKPGTAYYENEELDEHFILTSGKMVYMKEKFIHEDFKGLENWSLKHVQYAKRAANDYYRKEIESDKITYKGLEFWAKVKRFLKYKVYYKLPSGFRSELFYFYCYYLRLGFLDGKPGKIYAFLHSKWYRFLIDAYIYEHKDNTR